MDTKKIENIIIVILVLLNLVLLGLTVSDDLQDRRADRKTVETLTALLAEDGIALGPEADLLQETPAVCTVVRDPDEELARMEAMIGRADYEDQGGSIRYYYSNRGQALLRGTGEMDLLLTSGSVRIRGGMERTAERLFRAADVGTCAWSAPSPTELIRCCLWDGLPVYNARVSFDFSGDFLTMVSGVVVLTTETSRSTEGVMNAAGILVRFLEIVRSEGFICSTLRTLTPGYLMSVTVSGESTLTPVWHIETDTGDLYLNALTGAAETVS